jgi:primase-polymerase (primpol)-like protein
MTANITIIVASEKGLLVPVEAVNFQPDEELASYMEISGDVANEKQNVWIKSGDKIERKQISTGLSDGIYLIVKSGLSMGQDVILSASIGEEQTKKKNTSLLPAPPNGGRPGGPNGGM